jgi:hypothetical protein
MLRSEQNPEERLGLHKGPTSYKTAVNIYAERCGMCGVIQFVDEATLRGICAAAESGLDNPFKCDDCEEEYDELAYEG